MEKELIKSLLAKYNKKSVKIVDSFEYDVVPGSATQGDIKISFNVTGDESLYIQDVITKDNIHLYYEFMSDEDLKKYKDILFSIFSDRSFYVSQNVSLPNNCISFDSKYLYILEAKDTLKPIEEYIAEIKDSEAYKEYVESV